MLSLVSQIKYVVNFENNFKTIQNSTKLTVEFIKNVRKERGDFLIFFPVTWYFPCNIAKNTVSPFRP